MASDSCVQPEQALLQSTKTRRLTICCSCPRLRSSRKRRRQGNCKGGCSFSFSRFGQCLPTSVSSSWASFSPSSLPNPQGPAEGTLPSGQPWPKGQRSSWPPRLLVSTHTNLRRHLLLTAPTDKEDGYGNEQWNR